MAYNKRSTGAVPVAIISIIAGLVILLLHYHKLNVPLVPDYSTASWLVEAKINVQPVNDKSSVTLFLPQISKTHSIENEQFVSDGFGLATISERGNRIARWTNGVSTGNYNLFYRALVRPKEAQVAGSYKTRKRPSTLKVFTKPEIKKVARQLNKKVWRENKGQKKFTEALCQLALTEKLDDSFIKLLEGRDSRRYRLEVVTKLLAEEKIPAHLVHGVTLSRAQANIPVAHWLEIFSEGQWHTYDPNLKSWDLTKDKFVWWKGEDKLIVTNNPAAVKTVISVSPGEAAGVRAAIRKSKLKEQAAGFLSLSSLPVHTQAVFRQMLIIPFGALLVAFLRNVVGLKTFGTFMPVLIALSFRELQLAWGLLLFSSIVTLGLIARFYFEKLKLLLVPRLTATLTLVIIFMIAITLIADHLNHSIALSLALFPLVILTMTIERMSVVWEEVGAREALKQGIGSLAVASVIYFLVTNAYLEYLFFVFPELLLVVLGLAILLGRYKGYRLIELFRFKELASEEPSSQS